MNLSNFYTVINRIENDGGLGMRMPIGSCRMIYGLAKAMKPKVYIDVGTFVGLSVLWVARALEENGGDGKVYTVEIDNKWLELAKNNAKEVGLSHRIEFILGDSQTVLPKLNLKYPIDLVLLDSGNKSLYIKDFEVLESKLSKTAIVLAHDTTEYDVPFESAFLFREYIKNRKEYETMLIDYEYGMLIIKRR